MSLRYAIVLALIASACTVPTASPSATPTVAPTEAPVRGGTLVLPGTEPSWIQPAIDGPRRPVDMTIYETFAQADPQTAEIRDGFGKIAQSPDGKTYTVDIDPRAVWSDGTAISPSDWLTTVKAIARTKTRFDWLSEFKQIREIVGYGDYAAGVSEEVAGIRVEGRRLHVSFERVLCAARQLFAVLPPLPAHVFGKYVVPGGSGIAAAPENAAPPVTSGPFRLREWRRGDHMLFERNDRYWRGPPLLDGYIVKFVPATPEKTVEVLKTTENVLTQFAAQLRPEVEQIDRIAVHRVTPPGFDFFAWNTQSENVPGLRDARVRQALNHAIDWDLVIERIAPHGTRVDASIPASSWAFTPVERVRYDPGRSAELLRAAGYAKDATGIYAKDGAPLAFDLVTNAENASRKAIIQLAADQYSGLGIRVTPRVEPFAPLVESLVRGQIDVILLGFAEPPDPDGRSIWHSTAVPHPGASLDSGNLNVSRLANAELDRALDLAGSPLDGDCSLSTRKKRYATVIEIIAREHPLSFGFVRDAFVAVPANLRGYRVGPFNFGFYFADMHLWWLAGEAT